MTAKGAIGDELKEALAEVGKGQQGLLEHLTETEERKQSDTPIDLGKYPIGRKVRARRLDEDIGNAAAAV